MSNDIGDFGLQDLARVTRADAQRAMIDKMFLWRWGLTQAELMKLPAAEIAEIAEARGIAVTGIAYDGFFESESDGRDKRN